MRQRGFSLLEVVVAFSILSLSFGVLMQLYSTSLRNTTMATDYAIATELAESLLAEWTTLAPAGNVERTGEHAGRYRWSVAIGQDSENAPDPPSIHPFQLQRVKVRVRWSDGEGTPERTVLLDTLRVSRAGPKGS